MNCTKLGTFKIWQVLISEISLVPRPDDRWSEELAITMQESIEFGLHYTSAWVEYSHALLELP